MSFPQTRLQVTPYDIHPPGDVERHLSFAHHFGMDSAVVAWWDLDERFLVQTEAGRVSEWRARLPVSGAARWTQSLVPRYPEHLPGRGLRFDNTRSLALSGVTLPAGSRTVLVIHEADPAESGTSYILGAQGSTADRWGLYQNVVNGGSVNAAIGAAVVTQQVLLGQPTWHIMSYDAIEQMLFLETRGLGVVSVAAPMTPTVAECVMGGANPLAGGYMGVQSGGLLRSDALYSSIPATHAARAPARDRLRRYAEMSVQTFVQR